MSRFNGTKGVDWPHPGLGEDDVGGAGGGATHHKFYQWVTFVLTLQAGMFYLPRCEAQCILLLSTNIYCYPPVSTAIYLLLSTRIYCYLSTVIYQYLLSTVIFLLLSTSNYCCLSTAIYKYLVLSIFCYLPVYTTIYLLSPAQAAVEDC